MTVSQQISPSALRAYKLSKYANGQPAKMLFEAKRVKRVTSQFMSKSGAKEAAKKMKALKKTAANAKKIADATKKATDLTEKIQSALFKNIPGSAALDKASRVGGILGILSAIGLVLLVKLQEFVTGRAFDDLSQIGIELTKTNTIAVTNGLKIKTIQSKVDKFDKELDANAKDFARLNKQTDTIAKNTVEAKKQANDALYETREGRRITESKVTEANKKSNDALYEARTNKQNLEVQITGVRTSLEAKIQQVNSQISKLNNSANEAFQKAITTTVSKVQSDLAATKAQVNAIRPIPVNTAEINANAVAAAKAIVAPLQSAIGNLSNQTNAAVTLAGTAINGVSNLAQAVSTANNTASTAQQESQSTRNYVDRVLVPRIEATVTQSTGVKAEVAEVKQQIPALSAEIKQSQIRISEVDTKIKEQAKVNEQALPKLEQIVGILGLIPARAANAIRPDIPTIPQIEQAAATGTCRTTQPGGCMNKALNDNAANITNNNNTNAANILDAVNTGANAALLAGQQTILSRLGDQLPGGIGGKLSRFADWMHLDRVLNMMILGATIHNALMLSNDIGQTFVGIINNVLQLIGLKKEDGSTFDIGSVISSSIENLIKGAIGAENYTSLTTAWAKANRIYQASVNILNAFQGLSSAILTGLEMTAGKVAKIGNALRNAGEVLESAYGWMNPQPKFNRVTQTLENLQQGASTIQMVTQAPLDIINATTELTTATAELTNAIKQDNTEANKGKESPEPDKLKADQATAKLASASLEIADIDLDPDD
ncbi:hypothetical protein [Nostoc sp.]|uniref:hypothetical protein n=1 Tax=Nostoc sp. TaxID=1180 RepID=UPI002FF3C64F